MAIADECDLALLTVESDAFWEGVPNLPLTNQLARLQDLVSVVRAMTDRSMCVYPCMILGKGKGGGGRGGSFL